jgi:maleate isomerase
VTEHVPDDAEAVVLGGNGFRAVGVIEKLEATLRRPVLTANQTLLWAAMRAADASTAEITGYGKLFTLDSAST